ncbi:hypothetical protein [Alicyclobacillus sendaiensis]|uniref:Uncharacterized protein n=1 Tax=Alicyclobacillus acidocaldarius subsp. acidocaldarius (strain ATCC 27009 / DSM 446 / BCRC 14685 / JCM 5260 / KCTC 1825 / NBRC 15652 / NCIMB 11725 / NRRL B-14509 / 104-IA) TaxID=521098 RepID=C8WSX9_ALIAD|nr:hypothetical protein [Alicyclobacillus sendaiensis]ACV57635.1 hypothetical protein Aaci_0587 [Alicyclobacillus acidocaldarius subsp. acidocaldarius DSM 446]
MGRGRLISLAFVEFIFAVLAAWMIYAFLRVHSMSALVFALVVLAAMVFLIARYRRQAAREQGGSQDDSWSYGSDDEDTESDGEEW